MEKKENAPENPVYTPAAAAATPYEYPAWSRWLLLVTAAMGAVLALFLIPAAFDGNSNGFHEIMPSYFVFFLIYAAGFYILTWSRARRNAMGWYTLAAAFALMVRGMIFHASELSLINMLVIPSLLMINSIAVLRPVPAGLEGQWAGDFARGFFVRPFACISRWFGAVGSLFRKNAGSSRRGVLIGVLIALPVAAAVIALLISSDSVMKYYFSDMFRDVSFSKVFWRTLAGFAAAVLFFSFVFSSVTETAPVRTQPVKRGVPAVSMTVVIAVLLVIYAVFAYFQFAYLTGIRSLPEGLTYSEYAVSGFTELLFVAGINLAVFGVTLSFTEHNRATRPLLAALLTVTLVVLYSAIMRLCLYIGAYGLTVNRILPMWFMIFLLAAVVLCCIRLFNERLRLVRVLLVVLVGWYLALNVVNLDAVVARSIISRSEERGGISAEDLGYLRYELSDDALRVISSSPYCGEFANMD